MNLRGIRSLRLTLAGLIVAAAGLGALLFWGQGPVGEPVSELDRQPVDLAVAQTPAPPLARYQALMESPCFAKPDEATAPTEKAVELPSLDGFRLVGLMSGPSELALAVIEDAAGLRQEMVGPGDPIGPGRVAAVLEDRILVDLNGRRHQLVLEDSLGEAMVGILTIRSEEAERNEPAAPPEPVPLDIAEKGRLLLEPVLDSQEGVMVVSAGRLGTGLGLQAEDIIQAANPAEVRFLLEEIGEGRPAPLQVVRQGRSLNIRFNPL